MIKKFGIAAGLCAGLFGLGATHAQAQLQTLHTQILSYSGTCSGIPTVSGATLTIPAGQVVPTGQVTITGADIVLYQPPSPTSSLQYAVVGTAGDADDVYVWLGPGQTHMTTFSGSAGNYPAALPAGNGFNASNGLGINLTLACSGSSSWAAYVTIFYKSP